MRSIDEIRQLLEEELKEREAELERLQQALDALNAEPTKREPRTRTRTRA